MFQFIWKESNCFCINDKKKNLVHSRCIISVLSKSPESIMSLKIFLQYWVKCFFSRSSIASLFVGLLLTDQQKNSFGRSYCPCDMNVEPPGCPWSEYFQNHHRIARVLECDRFPLDNGHISCHNAGVVIRRTCLQPKDPPWKSIYGSVNRYSEWFKFVIPIHMDNETRPLASVLPTLQTMSTSQSHTRWVYTLKNNTRCFLSDTQSVLRIQ